MVENHRSRQEGLPGHGLRMNKPGYGGVGVHVPDRAGVSTTYTPYRSNSI